VEQQDAMMGARYTLDSVRSCVWVSGRSSLHPINTETRGITGWFEASFRKDGTLDLDQRIAGELELSVERLTSGNQLYDRELRRRMDAKRYPTIGGQVTKVVANGTHPKYLVVGDVSFHGKTRCFEHEMHITRSDDTVELSGGYVFDIREFGMKPPSMLMVRVYPEITVRVELHGTRGD
jgi:polyisoprenoid-binding protein YceI